MFGYDVGLTNSSPDQAVNGDNVSTLQQLFTNRNINNDYFGYPVESNGVVYVGETNGNLDAYDANGASDCSGTPNLCSPLWTGSTGANGAASAPAVANGVVYIVSADGSTLSAFEANGTTNCSGTPKVCQPLWTAPTTPGGDSSAVVADGVVYIGSYGTLNGGRVEAFNANGVTNCSGAPKTCQPLWTSSSKVGFSTPAVTNGVVYATGEDGMLYAFSANGTTDCSGTPITCDPLWTGGGGTSNDNLSPGAPTVSNGVVYYESATNLYAFAAGSGTHCSGSPTTCSPLWTAAFGGDYFPSLAVDNGILYASSGAEGFLETFDANGVTNCSGTPKACTPLWSYNVSVMSPPSVADGLVFIGLFNGDPDIGVAAFDAGGVTNCSGTPKVCNPLWIGPTSNAVTGPPAIANGKIYATDNGLIFRPQGDLYAWALPPPTTAVVIPSNNAALSGTEVLDASASPGVTQVQYEITGGSSNHSVIATANRTEWGWLANWDTTTVPNGTYTLQSVASYGGEVSGTSHGITVTVDNSASTISLIVPLSELHFDR